MTTAIFVPSAQAAFIAELSDRDMNRVFDEHLVPESLMRAQDGRRFARLASAFACWRRLKFDPLTRIVPTEI